MRSPLARDARRTKLLVFAGAATILVAGAVLAPRPREIAAPPPEPVAPLIEEEVRAQEPGRLLESLRGTLRGAIDATVTFETAPRPASVQPSLDWQVGRGAPLSAAALGVIVSASGEILTSTAAIDNVGRVRLADGRLLTGGRVVVFDPGNDLALVQIPSVDSPRPATLPPGVPAIGQFVVAAGRVAGAEFIVPGLLAAGSDTLYALDGAPPTLLPGTPLFDADGRALAIFGQDGPGPRVRAIGPALDRMRSLAAEGRAIPSVTGIGLQKTDPALQAFFGAGGVVISDVQPDSPAAAAGVQPGDLLQQIDRGDLTGPDDALQRLGAIPDGRAVALTISRRDRTRQVTVVPDRLLGAAWIAAGSRRAAAANARTAAEVFGADLLQRAGIPADAAILSVAGRAPRRPVRVTRPLLVYVDAHGTRYFAVVEPGS